jgi:SAM-dependent methyltransferase
VALLKTAFKSGSGSVAAVPAEDVYSSKTLSKFLSFVFSRPAAELIDLGPVIGSNIAFMGERVGCKIHVEDLYADLDRHALEGTFDRLPEFLATRFPLANESVDAVLCWDVFDYLGPDAGSVLADELIRMLRPGGALLGFFGARGSDQTRYTKYFIEDESRLRYRFYMGACRRIWVLNNRDIDALFAGLQLSDSVLMKSGVREVLFRKRSA